MESNIDIIEKIIRLEWEFFRQVPNLGGPASCQQDRETFEVMRDSQAASWSKAALQSYLEDLRQARNDGRNLLTEKYARMMATTAPEEYAAIAHRLPDIDPQAKRLVDAIVETVMQWELSLAQQYPFLFRRARPLFSHSDSQRVTSVETYLRGELETYSLQTLKLYRANIDRQVSRGTNGSAITLEKMVAAYGHESLEMANDAFDPGS